MIDPVWNDPGCIGCGEQDPTQLRVIAGEHVHDDWIGRPICADCWRWSGFEQLRRYVPVLHCGRCGLHIGIIVRSTCRACGEPYNVAALLAWTAHVEALDQHVRPHNDNAEGEDIPF